MPKSPRSAPNAARIIEVLAFPAVQLLDVTGPFQVFASANDIVAETGGTPPYVLRVVAKDCKDVTASGGLAIAASPLPRVGVALDTLMIAGGPGVDAASADPALIKWIRERARTARRVASVCTGAFLLARAGILDGLNATTHFHRLDELREQHPEIRVVRGVRVVDQGAVVTAGGVTAGIDLGLHLVNRFFGRQLANRVADVMEYRAEQFV